MKSIFKPNVIGTLRLLEQGDQAEFPLAQIPEPTVRAACSRLKSAKSMQFRIERTARDIIVTRL